MKTYSAIVRGKDMTKIIDLPDDYKNCDLKVVVTPVRKKKNRFAKLFANPIKVKAAKIKMLSKDAIHER